MSGKEIPDDWYENDTQAGAGDDMEPEGFTAGILAEILNPQKDKSGPSPPSQQSDSSLPEVSRDPSRR